MKIEYILFNFEKPKKIETDRRTIPISSYISNLTEDDPIDAKYEDHIYKTKITRGEDILDRLVDENKELSRNELINDYSWHYQKNRNGRGSRKLKKLKIKKCNLKFCKKNEVLRLIGAKKLDKKKVLIFFKIYF